MSTLAPEHADLTHSTVPDSMQLVLAAFGWLWSARWRLGRQPGKGPGAAHVVVAVVALLEGGGDAAGQVAPAADHRRFQLLRGRYFVAAVRKQHVAGISVRTGGAVMEVCVDRR